MEEVFEFLKNNKLNTDENIETSIMDRWNISKIMDLIGELFLKIEVNTVPLEKWDINSFPFLANSQMSARHGCGCIRDECRLRQIDDLIRFTILYSDCVYLPNYFSLYDDINLIDKWDEWILRNRVMGDLKIINRLKRLLNKRLVRFYPSVLCLCSEHSKQYKEINTELNNKIENFIDSLEQHYADSTSAILRVADSSSSTSGYKYSIEINCNENLFEHGSLFMDGTRINPSLRTKARSLRKTASNKGLQLTREDIIKAGIVRQLLSSVVHNLLPMKLTEKIVDQNLKYLTNNDIEVSLLHKLTEERYFNMCTDVLRNNLVYEIPIFQNLPVDNLIEIRDHEFDAFVAYRNTINTLVNEYVIHRRTFTANDAKSIYSDIIQPAINHLDSKFKSIREHYRKKFLFDLFISSSALTIGLCGNFIPSVLVPALYSLGLVKAVQGIESVKKSIDIPDEIRNDNFYFLLKLSKKSFKKKS